MLARLKALFDSLFGSDTPGSEADAAYDALASQRDPALEEARKQLHEPTMKLVMPNLGGGQEL